MLQLLRETYSADCPALKVIILKDLYKLLEQGLDRSRDAGNVIFRVSLRQSALRSLTRSVLRVQPDVPKETPGAVKPAF